MAGVERARERAEGDENREGMEADHIGPRSCCKDFDLEHCKVVIKGAT